MVKIRSLDYDHTGDASDLLKREESFGLWSVSKKRWRLVRL
jgi:hypothetical protein